MPSRIAYPRAAGLIWLTLAAAACAHTERQSLAEPGVLTVVAPFEITSVDPLRSGFVFTRLHVAETLVEWSDSGAASPGLADSWSVSTDGLAWRFQLRPEVRFHDGTLVAPDDAVRALTRARVAPGILASAPITAVEKTADAVVVRLREPFAALPALLAHSSTQVLAPSSFDAAGGVTRVIATGPYRVSRLAPPQRVELERFDDWHGGRAGIGRAGIDRVVYLAVGRAETRVLMAESGQADLVFGIDPSSLRRLRGRSVPRVLAVTGPRSIVLKVNAGHPWLSDVRVRRAFSLAFDRAAIARAILFDRDVSATQLFPPSLGSWHDARLKPLAFAPDMARRLLAEAGWTPGRDGIATRGGARFSVELRTLPDRPELPLIAEVLQEQLRQVGVEVRLNVTNSGDIPLGHRDGSLQLALFNRNYGLVPDPLGSLLQDFPEGGSDWGPMGWSNTMLTQSLAGASRAADATARAAFEARVARVLHDELPLIPIVWFRQNVAVGARVAHVTLDPLELSYRIPAMRWSEP